MSIESITLFAAAAFAIIVVPGPALIYVIARSVQQGRMAGLVSTWGVACGAYLQVMLAAYGLAALLAQSTLAFSVLRYIGAAYLIWLGIQQIRAREQAMPQVGKLAPKTLGRIYADGVVVCLLNPKSALFFLAFLPQFVDVASADATQQILMLGGVFVAIALVSDGTYALAAAALAGRFMRGSAGLRRARWLSGGALIGLGIATAVSGSRKS